MPDQFEFELLDAALLEEIELTADLIVAASEADGQLEQAQIDRILGVGPPSAGSPRSEDSELEFGSHVAEG